MIRPLPAREIVRPLTVPALKPLSITVAKLHVCTKPVAGIIQPTGDHP